MVTPPLKPIRLPDIPVEAAAWTLGIIVALWAACLVYAGIRSFRFWREGRQIDRAMQEAGR